jgi:hypothetical protein
MDLRPPADDRDPGSDPGSPRPDREPAGATDLLHPPPLDLEDLVRGTWSTYLARLPACLGAYWGAPAAAWFILLTWALLLSGLHALVGEPNVDHFLRFLLLLADVIVPAWLVIGRDLTLLRLVRREAVAPPDLFRGGPYLLTTLLAWLLFLAILTPPSLLVYWLTNELMLLDENDPILMAASFLGGLGLEAAVVFGILVRLGQFGYAIIDRGEGVVGSHRASWDCTRGRAATVILVYLLCLTINLAGLLAFCMGLVFTLPLTSLLLAATYDALSASAADRAPEEPRAWEDVAAG